MNNTTRVIGVTALSGVVAVAGVASATPAGASTKSKLVMKTAAAPNVVQHHTPNHCCP